MSPIEPRSLRAALIGPRPVGLTGVALVAALSLALAGPVGATHVRPAPLAQSYAYGIEHWQQPPITDLELRQMQRADFSYLRSLMLLEPAARRRGRWRYPYDGFMARLARHRIQWLPKLTTTEPRRTAPLSSRERRRFASFARAMALRYGPSGSFWRKKGGARRTDLPYLPIRVWEVWNEPNLSPFWRDTRRRDGRPGQDGRGDPNPIEFGRLLLEARRGLRSADPEARVLLGGLAATAGTGAMPPEEFLAAMVAAGPPGNGPGCAFDAVGIHPYAPTPEAAVAVLDRLRARMGALGLGDVPMWPNEFGWAVPQKADPRHHLTVDFEAQQEEFVDRFVRTLARRRGELRIGPAFYFALRDARAKPQRAEPPRAPVGWTVFDYMGLAPWDVRLQPRGAWYAYRGFARAATLLPLPPRRLCPGESIDSIPPRPEPPEALPPLPAPPQPPEALPSLPAPPDPPAVAGSGGG